MNSYSNAQNLSSIQHPPWKKAPIAHMADGLVSVPVPTGYRKPLCVGCAERARSQIDSSGLQRQEIAQLAGLGRSTVGQVEDGKNMPRLSTIERLGDALGISPTWLAYGDEGTIRFRRRRTPSPVPFDPPLPQPMLRPHPDAWRAVSVRLAAARSALKFTLRDVADAARVSAQTILLIERGESDPMITTIEQLAVALDVSPGWLAFGEGEGLPMVGDAGRPSKDRQ